MNTENPDKVERMMSKEVGTASDSHAFKQRYQQLHSETAKITWPELQRFFAMGKLIAVQGQGDLIQIATEISLDIVDSISVYIESGQLVKVTDDMAIKWHNEQPQFWAVVAAPYVLVQNVEHRKL